MLIIGGIILFTHPIQAQGLYLKNPLQDLNLMPSLINNHEDTKISIGCIKIDGRCQFSIAERPKELPGRIEIIESRLDNIIKNYVKQKNANLQIKLKNNNNLQDIYVYVDNQATRLMTVTNLDAEIDGTDILTKAELIKIDLADKIPIAKQERTVNFLIQQLIVSGVIIIVLIILQIIISHYLKRLKNRREKLKENDLYLNQLMVSHLTNRQKINFQEVQYRLLQLLNITIWLTGILVIFGLFPYTRFWQTVIINILRIPMRIVLISILTYVLVRLTYGLINQFSSTIINDFSLNPIANQRLELRVQTIARVIRSVVTIMWLAIGIIVALFAIGVNIAPILAGLGIFSLALSLGSQNLIKDAINGFFIILEDQYAVGDVINVNEVGGLVENINLRITQLRDAEGRLITIPNSEVRIVANLSSKWSRADLNIPISYNTDIDKALKIITEVADQMTQESNWRDKIIDQPEILGVDDFGNRGLMIKVWIKTQPLQQWLVSREFRRRLLLAFAESGIPLPPPTQEIWLNQNHSHFN